MAGLVTGIIGIALGATGTGLSFAQAGKAKRAARDAESKAEEQMRLARKRLEINYLDELAIQKEPYELAREAALQQGATALEAAREGDQRGIAATAGRLEVAQDAAQGQIRAQMGREMSNLDKLVAEEDARLRDLNVQLDLGEVQGFQAQAANQEAIGNQAMMQGFQGAVNTLGSAASLVPLYQQNKAAQQQAVGDTVYTKEQMQDFGTVDFSKKGGFLGLGRKRDYSVGLNDAGDLSAGAFRKLTRKADQGQKDILFGNQFLDIYNAQQGLNTGADARTVEQIQEEQRKNSGLAFPVNTIPTAGIQPLIDPLNPFGLPDMMMINKYNQ
jgi:hypothetical protein